MRGKTQGGEQKARRLRIVKLEERIAPSRGKANTANCYPGKISRGCWYYTINCYW